MHYLFIYNFSFLCSPKVCFGILLCETEMLDNFIVLNTNSKLMDFIKISNKLINKYA